MLNVISFVFNAFSENTYIISNTRKECWIVDPGMYHDDETQSFIDYIYQNGLVPKGIINTHTHLDHIFGVQALMDKYRIPFGVHDKELPVLNGAVGASMLFGFNMAKAPLPTFYIKETAPLQLAEDTLEVFFTPGHSPGSISFYYPVGKWVIAGDVLFSGSIGRTDLPGGNSETLLNSIHTQLFTLPGDTLVYPGHGPSTSISHEKRYNPFLK